MQQVLVRFGALYQHNEKQEFGFLYAFIDSDPNRNFTTAEHRLTQQFIQKFTLPEQQKGLIRLRLEERVLEENGPLTFRTRVMGRYTYQVKSSFELVAWDEIMLNLTKEKWNGNKYFDRNRLFLDAKYEFANISVEYGYMNQLVNLHKTPDFSLNFTHISKLIITKFPAPML